MSQSSRGRPRRKKSVGATCLTLNQFGTPGLGSVYAGRRLVGAAQLLLAVFGFVLLMCWAGQVIYNTYRSLDGTTQMRLPPGWMWECGVGTFFLSWCWAWVTTMDVLRKEKEAAARVPPVL